MLFTIEQVLSLVVGGCAFPNILSIENTLFISILSLFKKNRPSFPGRLPLQCDFYPLGPSGFLEPVTYHLL